MRCESVNSELHAHMGTHRFVLCYSTVAKHTTNLSDYDYDHDHDYDHDYRTYLSNICQARVCLTIVPDRHSVVPLREDGN